MAFASGTRIRLLDADAAQRLRLDGTSDIGSPFQAEGFVSAWTRTRGRLRGRRAVVLLAEDAAGRPTAWLPLEIVRRGLFQIARFPGETHANANGPLRAPGAPMPVLRPSDILAASREAGISIDALDLRRMPDISFLGEGFELSEAAEQRFAISLSGGLEKVLAFGNAKRKRHRFRGQQNYFQDHGGYAFLDLPPDRREAALGVFLAQKDQRFRELNMPNPFADAATVAFLHTLFLASPADARFYCIESGGELKALMGGVVAGGTFWGMFSSFAADQDAKASPGELLLWHLVERLSGDGIAMLDLGPGEERYKNSWCDRRVVQYDAVASLNRAGRAFGAIAGAQRSVVAVVKSDPRLRRAAQRIRRLVRGD